MNREVIIACLPFIAAIIASAIVMRLLILASGARLQLNSLRQLPSDERGAVQSLSFVLTLPAFVMLMLFIVQLSQLTIGRVALEHAAFAAARSAVVWIPANLGDDLTAENRIGQLEPLGSHVDDAGNLFTTFQIAPGSDKFEKVRLAAAAAMMPVSPSRDTLLRGESGDLAAESMLKAYRAMSPSSVENPRIPERLRNKATWALAHTSIAIETRHRDDEPPLVNWDIQPYREEFMFNEIGWIDHVIVTVSHDFALLPGPGRFLARSEPDPHSNDQEDRVAQRIVRSENVFTYPMSATAKLINEGEKPVVPFIQRLDIVRSGFTQAAPNAPSQPNNQ